MILISILIICISIIFILVVWTQPNGTVRAPDYYYSYDMTKNGTITNVIIHANFTFYFRNDVKFLETTGNDLEVKLWGASLVPFVTFHKADELLIIDIGVQSAVDNYLGSPRASEYLYLPKNWTYQIITCNEQGTTYVENQSWDYEAISKTP